VGDGDDHQVDAVPTGSQLDRCDGARCGEACRRFAPSCPCCCGCGETFLYTIKTGPAGNDTTGTGAPASPSQQVARKQSTDAAGTEVAAARTKS
jgi:hypothetical protein